MKLKSLYSFFFFISLVACNEDFNEGIAGVQTADPESPALRTFDILGEPDAQGCRELE